MKNENRTVGILTLPFCPNYGWLLQHYALTNTINNKLGYKTISIQRKWNNPDHTNILYRTKRFIYYNYTVKDFYKFYKDKINKTRPFNNESEINLTDYNVCAIVVGSDQVWRIKNTKNVGMNFFLDFISKEKVKKISYAASFGTDKWEEDEITTLKVSNLLKDFAAISVREDSGVKICNNFLNVDANQNIDPTFLLTKNEYLNIALSIPKKNNIVTSYILDHNNFKDEVVNYISKTFQSKIVNLYPKNKNVFRRYLAVEEWIRSIYDSKFVITDSFHGTALCIILGKQFIVIGNEKRGLTRFTSLLKKFNLLNRLIKDDLNTDFEKSIKPLIQNVINYEQLDAIITNERDLGLKYLENSLSDK